MLITFSDDKFQLDLRETNFGELIGFEKKLITKTDYGTKLPNITNSIDVLNINTNAIRQYCGRGEYQYYRYDTN